MLGSNVATTQPPTRAANSLTVAHALMAATVGLATLMRWVDLAALPLSSAEAVEALAPYSFSVGNPVAISSPAYFSLTTMLQVFIGSGDAAARAVPMLFGVGAVGLLWLLRKQVGTGAILLTGLLLAVSPVHSVISRTAGGDAIAFFCILLLLVCLLNIDAWSARQVWPAIGVALGVGFASSPLFISGLVALLLASWLSQLLKDWQTEVRPGRALLQQTALVSGVVFVVISTLLLSMPSGFGAAFDLLADWLTGFGFGRTAFQPFIIGARYETAPLIFGLIALIIVATRTHNRQQRLFILLTITGGALSLLQIGQQATALLWLLPLYLLIGSTLAGWLAHAQHWTVWLIGGAATVWGILTLVNLGRFTRLSPNLSPLLIAALIFCAIGFAALMLAPDPMQLLKGTVLGLFGTWLFFGWGTAWQLTHEIGNDARELWVDEGTDQDVRLLRITLQEASFQLTRALTNMEVVSSVDSPALRWYLRDFHNSSFGTAVPRSGADAVIVPEGEIPPLEGVYAEASFDLHSISASVEQELTILQRVRWWFFQDTPFPPAKQRVTVWLNVDS